MDKQAAARAKVRITEMMENAAAFTEALGLPPEKTITVLSVMYKDTVSPADTTEKMAQPATSDDVLKNRIFQLSEGYISTHRRTQLPSFRTFWERLKTLPVEALDMGIQQRSPSAGLGFADSQSLIPVVSLISWAVINQSTLTASTPEKAKEAIVQEAESRGFPRSQSYAIALYLQPRLLSS
jgi:hypothetical protein